MRAPFQVLVFPYCIIGEEPVFALLKRDDMPVWQGVSGGGEGEESPAQAAARELEEETGIKSDALEPLDSMSMISVVDVTGEFSWGNDVYVIPEYSFGVRVEKPVLVTSDEHTENRWASYVSGFKPLT